jgi:hypothetical protein
MACCGQTVRRTPAASGPAPDPSAPVLFEYSGPGPLTLFGRRTGRRYHFPSGGARVYVDGRDAPIFEVMQGLAVVGRGG